MASWNPAKDFVYGMDTVSRIQDRDRARAQRDELMDLRRGADTRAQEAHSAQMEENEYRVDARETEAFARGLRGRHTTDGVFDAEGAWKELADHPKYGPPLREVAKRASGRDDFELDEFRWNPLDQSTIVPIGHYGDDERRGPLFDGDGDDAEAYTLPPDPGDLMGFLAEHAPEVYQSVFDEQQEARGREQAGDLFRGYADATGSPQSAPAAPQVGAASPVEDLGARQRQVLEDLDRELDEMRSRRSPSDMGGQPEVFGLDAARATPGQARAPEGEELSGAPLSYRAGAELRDQADNVGDLLPRVGGRIGRALDYMTMRGPREAGNREARGLWAGLTGAPVPSSEEAPSRRSGGATGGWEEAPRQDQPGLDAASGLTPEEMAAEPPSRGNAERIAAALDAGADPADVRALAEHFGGDMPAEAERQIAARSSDGDLPERLTRAEEQSRTRQASPRAQEGARKQLDKVLERAVRNGVIDAERAIALRPKAEQPEVKTWRTQERDGGKVDVGYDKHGREVVRQPLASEEEPLSFEQQQQTRGAAGRITGDPRLGEVLSSAFFGMAGEGEIAAEILSSGRLSNLFDRTHKMAMSGLDKGTTRPSWLGGRREETEEDLTEGRYVAAMHAATAGYTDSAQYERDIGSKIRPAAEQLGLPPERVAQQLANVSALAMGYGVSQEAAGEIQRRLLTPEGRERLARVTRMSNAELRGLARSLADSQQRGGR